MDQRGTHRYSNACSWHSQAHKYAYEAAHHALSDVLRLCQCRQQTDLLDTYFPASSIIDEPWYTFCSERSTGVVTVEEELRDSEVGRDEREGES